MKGAAALVNWLRRRRPAGAPFTHHREVAVIMWVVVAMTILEGAVLDLILRVVLGPSPWVWIALGLHVYAVYLLIATYAALVTRPHTLDGDVLHIRAGLGTEVAVTVADIDEASAGRYPGFDRSGWAGWKADDDANATVASGEARLRLTLAPQARITVNGRSVLPPRTLHLTADDPRRMAAAIRAALPHTTRGAEN